MFLMLKLRFFKLGLMPQALFFFLNKCVFQCNFFFFHEKYVFFVKKTRFFVEDELKKKINLEALRS